MHPGTVLQRDFLLTHGLTVAGLAMAVGVSRQSINELLRGRRAVSPEMALRFSRLFGTTAEYWLNAQAAVDLWDAAQVLKGALGRITPLPGVSIRHRARRPDGTHHPSSSDERGA
jgi:addiction module HigA family antidote